MTLLETLKTIAGTGQFHASGKADFFLPELHLDSLGEIAFPLHPIMAAAIKDHAEVAPYGRGEDTILDESVRSCWQIDASNYELRNPKWKKFLKKTTSSIANDLGITDPVLAEPYKLLLYEEGGHFLPHRDTEKIGEMFGTLIVALPSPHEGGELLIRHQDQEVTIDFAKAKNHCLQYAAFFADCEHQVLPVTSGYRCCLVYNLRLKKGDPTRLNPPLTEQSRRLLPHLQDLKPTLSKDFVAILLEHHYTEANLSLRQLKNNDQARAHALIAAAQEAGLKAHLALVTYHQMGELEDGYDWHEHSSSGDETMGEVYEENLSLNHWRNSKDLAVDIGYWRTHPDQILSEEEIGSGDPHHKEAEGYTGNAGCTMDYWYHHAAIILWPPEAEESLLVEHNLHGACQSFLVLSKNKTSPSRFPILGQAIIKKLATQHQEYSTFRASRSSENIQTVLHAIANQANEQLLHHLFDALLSESLQACDHETWDLLLKKFPPSTFTTLIQNIPDKQREDCRDTSFSFLESLLSKDKNKEANSITPLILSYQPSARIQNRTNSIDSLASLINRFQQPEKTTSPGNASESHIILAASHLLEKKAKQKKARQFLHSDRSLTHLRETLAPALLGKKLSAHFQREKSLFPEFLAFAISTLEEEIKLPLHPYSDFARPCPDLSTSASTARYYSSRINGDPVKELQNFMASPTEESHDFKYAQALRDNLSNLITEHQLDLKQTTIKKGTPHTLRCTKTDQSHQRTLKRRKDDQSLLKKLQKLA